MEARFTWDPKKAEINLRIHGVSFETAEEAFGDPLQVFSENYLIDGEQRLQIIGMTEGLVLLMVVFVDRSELETEVFHIISARKAESNEERIYAEQIS